MNAAVRIENNKQTLAVLREVDARLSATVKKPAQDPTLQLVRREIALLELRTTHPAELVSRLGTQQQVAEMLGLSQQAIAKFCRQGWMPEQYLKILENL